jgi:hypothetical protein
MPYKKVVYIEERDAKVVREVGRKLAGFGAGTDV